MVTISDDCASYTSEDGFARFDISYFNILPVQDSRDAIICIKALYFDHLLFFSLGRGRLNS